MLLLNKIALFCDKNTKYKPYINVKSQLYEIKTNGAIGFPIMMIFGYTPKDKFL